MNINEYGKIVRIYHGNGKIRLTNGNELPCSTCIQQIETGLILIKCRFDINIEQARPILQLTFDTPHQADVHVKCISGITSDGLNFETRGELVISSASLNSDSTLMVIMFVAQGIELSNENQHKVGQHYKFSVVNFEFKGNPRPKKVIQDGRPYSLELNTPWGIAILNPTPDYDNVIRKVKVQKSISVTCELIAQPSEGLELNDVINKIDELCYLLSLARGTQVNWISAEEYTEDEQTCRIILRNAVTWPFSGLALIDPNNPQDTSLFVEKVYPIYLKLRDGYSLDAAIKLYLDAKRETAYLETRALRAVSLLDFLIGRYASQRNLDKIRSDFEEKEQDLCCCLKEDIQMLFPGIKENELNEMLAKISELNRRSFLNLLKRLWCDLKLNIPKDELLKVKDTRNALVHKAEFQSTNGTDKKREYFRVIRLIDQLFLKLLGYDGYFIDINLDTLEFERRLFS